MQRDQLHKTNELLERIAIALEKNNKKESIHPDLLEYLKAVKCSEFSSERKAELKKAHQKQKDFLNHKFGK